MPERCFYILELILNNPGYIISIISSFISITHLHDDDDDDDDDHHHHDYY